MKNSDNLGRSIVRSRKGRSIGKNTSQLHNVVLADGPEWSKMGSITEQNDLDDLMTVAHLAGKEFTAERGTAAFVQRVGASHFEEKVYNVPSDSATQEWIRIPRKPSWNLETSKDDLHRREQESFLEWRRQLAKIEESDHFILTPFERNLDIWRQLWRVLELSDVIIQIVDARNPEVFYCADLVTYANELDSKKESLLLLNKADLLTEKQREQWSAYFKSLNVNVLFYSALASADTEEGEEAEPPKLVDFNSSDILTSDDFLFFLKSHYSGKTVGLVGYPNVGKSSTINSLIGEKKVAVAMTPGKTKHYQTLLLGNGIKLCDCPGLVFPNFTMTKSELVLNGILPVDQLKDWWNPVGLLADRIPRDIIERHYGIMLPVPSIEEDPNRKPTASEILCCYALARGFMTSNVGNPDQARASRILLKDYVAGKLLFSHAPPGVNQDEFSQETLGKLRLQLPQRYQPKPHKPKVETDDFMLASTIGFVKNKPGEKPVFAHSKKHFKGKGKK